MAYVEGGQSKRCRETLPEVHCVRWLWRKSSRPGTPRLPGRGELNRMGRYHILSRRDASLDPMCMVAILPME